MTVRVVQLERVVATAQIQAENKGVYLEAGGRSFSLLRAVNRKEVGLPFDFLREIFPWIWSLYYTLVF